MRTAALLTLLCLVSCSDSKRGGGTPSQIARFEGGPALMKETDYFETDSGDLRVAYTVSSTQGGMLTITVENGEGDAGIVCSLSKEDGSNRVHLDPGRYFLRVVADRCDWSATVFED